MATNEIKTKLTLDGVDDAVKGIKKLGTEGEAAAKQINDAFGDLKVGTSVAKAVDDLKNAFARLQATSRRTVSGFQDIASGAEQMARGIERGIRVIGLFSAAVGGVVGGAALLAKSSADTAEQIQNQADAFGVSFDNMQKLRDAIKAVGGDEGLLEKSLTKFTNAAVAADGATDDLGNKVKKFNGVTQTGLPGLIQYAKGLQGLGTTQAQLAKVSQDFGAKGAVTLLAFLRQLTGEFDAATAAADKIIPALDQLGQAKLADLDTAGDKLAKNFSRLGLLVGSEIAPAFTALYDTIREVIGTVGPALARSLGQVASAIAEQVTANKAEIIAFAKDITASIIAVAGDIRDALKGINSGDTNNWIVTLKRNVVGTFTFIRDTVTNVLIPAFRAFAGALEPIAKLINAVFGTQYTGQSLAFVAVIAQLTGGFKLLGGALKIARGGFKVLFDLIFGGKAKVLALIETVKALTAVAIASSRALLALVIANPELAAIVIAVAAVAGGVAYLATRQTDAEKAAEAHAKALSDLKDIQNEIDADLPGATQKLEEWKDANLAAAVAVLKNAEAQLTLQQQKLDQMTFDLGPVMDDPMFRAQLDAQAAKVREWSESLRLARLRIADIGIGYDDATKRLQNLKAGQDAANVSMAAGAGEVNKLAEGYKRILVKGPNGFEKAFDVPTQKLLDAKQRVDELAQSLQQPAGENTILDDARARAQQFLSEMEAVVARYDGIISSLVAKTAEIRNAFASSFSGLAEGFNAIGATISAVWANAMVRIIDNTRAMVRAVTGLIGGLRSQLASLTAAISRAASATRTTSTTRTAPLGTERFASGGYIRGPGTGTSDSIPAWLSNGEFVIRAAAVRRYGADLFAALNGLRLKPSAFPGFAGGGLVGVPSINMPALPMAANANGAGLTLVLDGESFAGLTGPDETLSRLERAIKTRRIRSTGRASPYATR